MEKGKSPNSQFSILDFRFSRSFHWDAPERRLRGRLVGPEAMLDEISEKTSKNT